MARFPLDGFEWTSYLGGLSDMEGGLGFWNLAFLGWVSELERYLWD
jgi:hypothetical protein